MHVNLELFFHHHDREFDLKIRGNFIIRYCNRNFIFNSNTMLHLRWVWDGFVCSGIYNHSLLLLENFLYLKKKKPPIELKSQLLLLLKSLLLGHFNLHLYFLGQKMLK